MMWKNRNLKIKTKQKRIRELLQIKMEKTENSGEAGVAEDGHNDDELLVILMLTPNLVSIGFS